MVYDLNATTDYIRRAAQARGIDPDIAVRVARSEGLGNGIWQSGLSKGGRREPSYGPFQLLVGGEGTNYPAGMGNDFKRATGLDPSDPANLNATIDYALDRAAKDGWGAWYGAAKVGVGKRDGIGGAASGPRPNEPSALTGAVADRQMSGGQGDRTLAGGAGGDQIATGGGGPTVNIGLPSERGSKAAEAMIEAGNKLGSNARNGWDVAGGLAQVLAGNMASKRAEEGEASALQKVMANLDPEYAMAAQLLGGRDGAAQAILSQQEARTAAATRAEARADRQATQEYERDQDAIDNARADATLKLQQDKANAPADPPSSVREYEYAKTQGFTGTFAEWEQQNRKAGATVVNTGGGENKQVFDAVAESAASARAAATGLNGLAEAKRALDGGMISGAGADTILGLQKVGAFLGVVDPSAIQNTETFRAAIAPQVAAVMKATVGSTQISNADRDFAERAAGGSISLDAGSISRLIDIMDRASRAAIASHNDRLNAVYPEGGQFDRERALFNVTMPEALPQPGAERQGLVPGQDTTPREGGVPVGGAAVRRARNPQTGQILELRNGQWVPTQ